MLDIVYDTSGKLEQLKAPSAYASSQGPSATIQGKILSKDGKNIRISATDGNLYDLVTKENLNIKNGETLRVKRSDLEMIQKVTEEKIENEKAAEKEEIKDLEKLELDVTAENLDAIKVLKEKGIPITSKNIESFALMKITLNDIKKDINFDSLTLASVKNKNLKNMSLTEFSSALKKSNEEIKLNESPSPEVKKSPDEKLSYDEARKIAKKIYGSEMGKDIQDIIISLDSVGAEINKETVDEVHDVFSKLYDLKDIDNITIANVTEKNESISINLLYNAKNLVSSSRLSYSPSYKSFESNSEFASYSKEISNEEIETLMSDVKELITDMGLEVKDYEDIAKSLLEAGKAIEEDVLVEVKTVRESVEEIIASLDKDVAAVLMKEDIDIANIDVDNLLSLIKEIQNQLSIEKVNMLTAEEKNLGAELVMAIREITPSSLMSSHETLKTLLNRTEKGRDYYKSNLSKDLGDVILSDFERQMLQTASIVTSISKIDFSKLDYRRNSGNVTLMDLAKSQGLIPEDYKMPENSLVKISYVNEQRLKVQNDRIEFEEYTKIEITHHYEYMRHNMRGYHVKDMLQNGINVLESDLRFVSNYVEEKTKEVEKALKTIHSVTDIDINRLASSVLSKGKDVNTIKIKKFMELSTNTNSYFDDIDDLLSISRERGFYELSERIEKLIERFKPNILERGAVKHNMENMSEMLFRELKSISEIITSSDRPDKEIFQRQNKQIADNIRLSSEVNSGENMVQIPFYMNGEGSNANVFAKSSDGKNGKKIDPENMTVFMDLNTKNLGKTGFFMKVKHKSISLKMSGTSYSISKLKSGVLNLSSSFESIGYKLENIDLVTPEESSKIMFFEEETKPQGMVDYKV